MKKNIIKNSNDLIKLKESFDKSFDKQINTYKLQEKVNSFDNLGFGELKSLFEAVSDVLFDNGKDCMAKYIKTIKENKALSTMYQMFEHTITPKYTENPSIQVACMAGMIGDLDRKELNEGMKKLRSVVKECVFRANVTPDDIDDILDKRKEINGSLDYILTTKQTPRNLLEFTDRMNKVVNYINENMSKDGQKDESKTKDELISDLNEAVSSNSVWETELAKDMALCFLSESSKEDLFNRYKNDCISLLEEKISDASDMEEQIRFSSMKDSLANKIYDESKLNESMIKLAELKYMLESE